MSVDHLQQAVRGPTAQQPSDDTLARRDLDAAVSLCMARESHLLTAGEHRLLLRFAKLPEPGRALFARLLARKPTAFRVGALDYAEVVDPRGASRALVDTGFAEWAHALWSSKRLSACLSVAVLRNLLRAAGLSTAGTKQRLTQRLEGAAVPLDRSEAWVALRHRAFFHRVVRLALAGVRGGLEQLVLARLGVVAFPRYTPTGGPGLWPTRGALVAWETALRRRHTLSEEAAVADLPRALAAVEGAPVQTPFRTRWSARRHDEAICSRALAVIERAGGLEQACSGYERLLRAGSRKERRVRKRLALCLAERGNVKAAVTVCAEGLVGPSAGLQLDAAAWDLHRTGRRLARKAGLGWRPLPPLDRPRERVLRLPGGTANARRPTFLVQERELCVEPAVRTVLERLGREARHVERALWTTLFAVLLRPALFAPVPGMLPSPLLRGPLDLGTPSFWRARASLLEQLLAEVQADPMGRLDASLAKHGTEQVVGARWDRVNPSDLRRVVADLPSAALTTVLRILAQDWRGQRRGLPDLVVLPGPQVQLPGAALGRIGCGVLFVELKTRRDRLSDEQRIWLHRLGRAGASAEVWRVEALG